MMADFRVTTTKPRALDGPIKASLLLGTPLVASLVVLLADWSSRWILNTLVFILFGCALTYLLRIFRTSMQRRQLGRMLFMVGFIGWYAFPALSNALDLQRDFGQDMPAAIESETVVVTVLLLSLFLLSWGASLAFFSRSAGDQVATVSTPTNLSRKRLYVIVAFAVGIGLFPYLTSGLRPTELVATIAEARAVDKPWSYTENLGNQTSAILYLASSFLAAAACLLWSSLFDKKLSVLSRGFFTTLAIALTLLIYFDQGTRSVTILVLLPSLLLFFVRLYRKSRVSFFVAALLVAAILFALLQFQLLFRTNYTRGQVNELLLEDWQTLGGTSDYFSETLLAVHIVPRYHEFFRESALLQFVVSPIPRFIWENKPVTQVAWFYGLIRWGIDIYTESGNVFPGIVGQYYMSWSWLGSILVGFIMGWFTRVSDRLLLGTDPDLSPYRFLLGAMLATWILVTYRFLSPGFLYPVVIVAGILWLARGAPRKRMNESRSSPALS